MCAKNEQITDGVEHKSELTGSVPESFALAFDEFKRRDEAHDGESIRSAFKAQEAWSNLQKELIAWVEREQNDQAQFREERA